MDLAPHGGPLDAASASDGESVTGAPHERDSLPCVECVMRGGAAPTRREACPRGRGIACFRARPPAVGRPRSVGQQAFFNNSGASLSCPARTSASRISPRAAPSHLRSLRTWRVHTGSRTGPNVFKLERSRRVATRAWCTSLGVGPGDARRSRQSWLTRRSKSLRTDHCTEAATVARWSSVGQVEDARARSTAFANFGAGSTRAPAASRRRITSRPSHPCSISSSSTWRNCRPSRGPPTTKT